MDKPFVYYIIGNISSSIAIMFTNRSLTNEVGGEGNKER